MPINTPYLAHLAGVPSQWNDTINPVNEGLIVGETPALVTEDMTMAANQTVAHYTPVGFNAAGHLVPAVYDAATPANAIVPVGVTLADMIVGATVVGAPIIRQGCLNVDMINWPASFDTLEKKLEAFRGAPTPTAIVVRKVYLGATVAGA